MIRVVFTGSESTGKSSLAWRVAKYYNADYVPEFVRGYAEKIVANAPLSEDNFFMVPKVVE